MSPRVQRVLRALETRRYAHSISVQVLPRALN